MTPEAPARRRIPGSRLGRLAGAVALAVGLVVASATASAAASLVGLRGRSGGLAAAGSGGAPWPGA
jgi:hypothetical protein